MVDRKQVVDILEEDGKTSDSTIAAMLGESEEEVKKVREQMEKDRIILRYSALINSEAMGEEGHTEALVELKISPERDFGYDEIAGRVAKFPEVQHLFLMSGRYDLSVLVRAKSMKAISQFVWEKLAVLDGVVSTQTLFIMRKYKEYGETLKSGEKSERLVVTP